MNARSGRNADDRRADEPAESERKPSDLAALAHGLLEQVLQETESASQESNGPNAAAEALETAALQAIARRYAGAALVLDPILVDLVEEMLTSRFKSTAPSENWRAISRQVAEHLLEDPQSQRRLAELWQRLSQRGV